MDSNRQVLAVISSLDFLDLALRYQGPSAVLKSRDARALDRRKTILDISVPHDGTMFHALRVMDKERQPVCLATSRELSGDFGGAASVGVVQVSDLGFVVGGEEMSVLDKPVKDFIEWRAGERLQSTSDSTVQRFNVVSVDANETLHVLASRLLSSKSRRVFLSSDEISRVVGMVSARDILVEIHDQLVQSCTLGKTIKRKASTKINRSPSSIS